MALQVMRLSGAKMGLVAAYWISIVLTTARADQALPSNLDSPDAIVEISNVVQGISQQQASSPVSYSTKMLDLIKTIEAKTQTHSNLRQALIDSVSVLARKSQLPPGEEWRVVFNTQTKATEVLIENMRRPDWNAAEKLKAAEVVGEFLGNVYDQTIPNFKPYKVPMNVGPPNWSGPSAAGMDPAAIADPKVRSEYEAEIAKGQEQTDINVQQTLLSQTQYLEKYIFLEFIQTQATKDPANKAAYAGILKKARYSQEVIDSL